MDTQNVTLTLPKAILRKAKVIAAERQTSLSRLLTEALEQVVAGHDRVAQARRRHLEILERGFDMGTGGSSRWSREELHDR